MFFQVQNGSLVNRKGKNRLIAALTDLVKVKDDLVQETDALDAIVHVLRVEVGEVRDGGEEDGGAFIRLGVQLL